jgi:AcrR family transcriptional regulator
MSKKNEGKVSLTSLEAPYKKRVYNSEAMKARRSRILSETLALIEEKGLNGVTIREVSKRSGVALRTLYLYFESREEMVSIAIKEFFLESISKSGPVDGPSTLPEVLDRLDRLTDIVLDRRAYAAALAPIFFSQSIDIRIYEILKEIAVSHVKEFLDALTSSEKNNLSENEKHLLYSQIANIEFAVIDDALRGRISEDQLNLSLKIAVLSLIQGFVPKPPPSIRKSIAELREKLR